MQLNGLDFFYVLVVSSNYIDDFALLDAELVSRIKAYLSSITVTEHNPAIFFYWNNEALEKFVDAANAESSGHPQWFSQPQGSVTPMSVMNDIITNLAQLSGGRCDHVLLAPNSLIQYGHVQERLQYMQYDDFMQKCMTNVAPGNALARTFALTSPSIERVVPIQCLPPPPRVRQLFE
ncbi:uncharacterized protein CCR75_009581 [Bremia lactucae]|uniref:Uncharacterized protein n=1 Tax=Bremia lactucae TaxID=4779 RepID=A0A976FKD8_BRELC|nr:hypothetical protein CCR75_009571 [Bremia lactucae]TDH68152.1 hypothetical protein CCR75_009581 [Bremia lactucae]